MKIKRNKRLNVKETEDWLDELSQVSLVVRKTVSDFVREAVDEKKERLAKRNPKVAQIMNREEMAA